MRNLSAPAPVDSITSMLIGILATALLLIINAPTLDAQNVALNAGSAVRGAVIESAPVANAVPRGSVRVQMARAVRALTRGETISKNDFVVIDTVIQWHYNTPPDAVTDIAGWVTRRTYSAGDILRRPGVAEPTLIMMGSAVKVLWQDGPVRLTLSGTATNNAAMGAPVGVRIDKNRRLDGIAVGPNTVRLR